MIAGLTLIAACASNHPSPSPSTSTGSGANKSPKVSPADQIDLRLDTAEADASLVIISRAGRSEPISTGDWELLFGTDGYHRLAQREKEIGRAIDEAAFESFMTSPATVQREPALRATLEQWKSADLHAAAQRVLEYLPADAHIRATVFPVIKPQPNSFVFEPTTNPCIFLYIDPALTREKFENTVAHELHHIGFASIPEDGAQHSAKVETVLKWMSAFGEGFAMLAAAGGPDVHPHEHSSAADRARWDRDVANFDADLAKVQTFFMDILDGRLSSEAEIDKVAASFFGVQGPWYTVGWKMAVVVEKRYGRATLIEGMRRPERLLATYNVAAAAYRGARGGEHLALWSTDLLARVGATPIAP